MALDVYYKKDIVNALQAADRASSAACRAGGNGGEYQTGWQVGYRDALATLAQAFGLAQAEIMFKTDEPDRWIEQRETVYILAEQTG